LRQSLGYVIAYFGDIKDGVRVLGAGQCNGFSTGVAEVGVLALDFYGQKLTSVLRVVLHFDVIVDIRPFFGDLLDISLLDEFIPVHMPLVYDESHELTMGVAPTPKVAASGTFPLLSGCVSVR